MRPGGDTRSTREHAPAHEILGNDLMNGVGEICLNTPSIDDTTGERNEKPLSFSPRGWRGEKWFEARLVKGRYSVATTPGHKAIDQTHIVGEVNRGMKSSRRVRHQLKHLATGLFYLPSPMVVLYVSGRTTQRSMDTRTPDPPLRWHCNGGSVSFSHRLPRCEFTVVG